MTGKALTPKQESFCLRYIETSNASEAYRLSYDAARSTDKTVWEQASKLLADLKVAARVAELSAKHLKRHEITVDRVLGEYAKLAFLDIRKAFDEGGKLKPIHDLDDDTAAAIAGLEVETKVTLGDDGQVQNRLHKIKLSDKKGALDSLAKHLGMFVERSEVSGPNGGPVETKSQVTLRADLAGKSLDELTRLFTERLKP